MFLPIICQYEELHNNIRHHINYNMNILNDKLSGISLNSSGMNLTVKRVQHLLILSPRTATTLCNIDAITIL